MIRRIVERQFDLAAPRFGQIAIWIIITCAAAITFQPFEYAQGERNPELVTVISWLPVSILENQMLFNVVRGLFALSAVMWLFRKWTPWTCWATVLTFTFAVSLRFENSTSVSQMYNLTNMLLAVHALWHHLCDDRIKEAAEKRAFSKTLLYPRWVFGLSLFSIAWFHTLAGISKLRESGSEWGDGVSLQLWTNLLGEKGSLGSDLLMLDTEYSAMFQTALLGLECAALVCLLHWSLRYVVGIGLTVSYVAMCMAFPGLEFYFNAVPVALFLLPFDRWFGLGFSSEIPEVGGRGGDAAETDSANV
ncbi:MAG: hypothetical protein AAF456_11080 [Planctomycetota bacterium]